MIAVALTMAPLCRDDGTIDGVLMIARDTSGRGRADRATRRLAAIVESSEDAVVSKDLNGFVHHGTTPRSGFSATRPPR